MTTTIIQLPPLYLAKSDAAKYLSLSETSFERLVAANKIAKPRKISEGRSAWLVKELEAYGLACPVSDLLPPANTSKKQAAA